MLENRDHDFFEKSSLYDSCGGIFEDEELSLNWSVLYDWMFYCYDCLGASMFLATLCLSNSPHPIIGKLCLGIVYILAVTSTVITGQSRFSSEGE